MTFAQTVATQEPKKVEKIGEGKFGARLATFANGYRAVMKTASSSAKNYDGKTRFRGVKLSTVPLREVAFWELAKYIGWQDIVPETVLGSYKGEIASYQQFVPSIYIRDLDKRVFNPKVDTKERLHALRKAATAFPRDEWRRMVLLDLIANNRDRHGKNIVVTLPGPHLVLIDNSIALRKTFARYRSVFHKYLFPRKFALKAYLPALRKVTRSGLKDALSFFLSPTEIDHIFLRAQFILRRPYLVPFKKMSDGQRGINDFPSRREFFAKEGRRFDVRPLVILPDQGFKVAAQTG